MQRKGGVFYDALTHIPLMISWPGHIAEGIRSDAMVNLVDIVPTLLKLQGLPVTESMPEPGLPVAVDVPKRDATFSEYGAGGPQFTLADLDLLPKPLGSGALRHSLRWREAEGRRKMVVTDSWKYVHDAMFDIDELYDLVKDPNELYNVAQEPTNRAVIIEMQRRLMNWSINTEGGHPVPLPDPVTHW
jgi:arylsulfatase A-like enzyme